MTYLFICYSEATITIERVQKILAAGANVILTTKGIDDLCLKLFVENGAMAVRRCKKEDLRRIAKTTGGIHIYIFTFIQILIKYSHFIL